MLVHVCVGNISEAELPAPKTRRDRASAVQRPNVCHNAVLGRAHGMADLQQGVPQWQTGEKKHEILMVFKGKHRH